MFFRLWLGRGKGQNKQSTWAMFAVIQVRTNDDLTTVEAFLVVRSGWIMYFLNVDLGGNNDQFHVRY